LPRSNVPDGNFVIVGGLAAETGADDPAPIKATSAAPARSRRILHLHFAATWDGPIDDEIAATGGPAPLLCPVDQ
jgi:hypothetical protein